VSVLHLTGQARAELQGRVHRVRVLLLPAALIALGAGVAWFAARELLGHSKPIFAAISAVIALGLAPGGRLRRAVETVIGVSLGILVADLLVLAIGRGSWQIVAVALPAMLVAAFLSPSIPLVTQACISAVLVVTLDRPSGVAPARFFDCLVGGAVAIVIGQLLFPPRVVPSVARVARPLLRELAATLRDIGDALDTGSRPAAERALRRARAMDREVRELQDAVTTAAEAVRFAPARWPQRNEAARLADLGAHVDHAVRNSRVLGRAVQRHVRIHGSEAHALAWAVRTLAEAVAVVEQHVDEPEEFVASREAALAAIAATGPVLRTEPGVTGMAIANQVQSIAADLLRISAVPADEIVAAVDAASEGVAAS
jgi:uncharacterized membrane protein YgaE (UPF0421/DUF939 family)